ncbi:hypothetical protein [Saccharothrix sp. Mg75]|uniref:hypothetical protein n=1 Tax=Saccharothrix sp. Mg75 TaxID=3445357 RepID=UPI003EEAF009
MGLSERLDAVRGEAAADGVAVVVDLHGKLVGLTFERHALAVRPGELAGTVERLAAEAAGRALAEGAALVAEVVPEGLPEGLPGR